MVDQKSTGDKSLYVSKKCHSCYEYVPLEAEKCPSCKVRLGKVGAHGMAETVTDWHSYVKFAVALIALLIFCKYAFF